jgi:hypothetical protein
VVKGNDKNKGEAWAVLPGTEDPSDELSVRMAASLVPLLVDIDQVIPDPANPRITRDLGALVASLRRFGVRKPIVVNRRGRIVEAGHQTLAAVRAVKGTQIPVVWVDDDPLDQTGYNIADNRTGEIVAEWDGDALGKLLKELHEQDDGAIIGWEAGALEEAISGLQNGSGGGGGILGGTSTDRAGQGVSSTWEGVKNTDNVPARLGDLELSISRAVFDEVSAFLANRFASEKTPYKEAFEAILQRGIDE